MVESLSGIRRDPAGLLRLRRLVLTARRSCINIAASISDVSSHWLSPRLVGLVQARRRASPRPVQTIAATMIFSVVGVDVVTLSVVISRAARRALAGALPHLLGVTAAGA